jgi:proline dehydrogenase
VTRPSRRILFALATSERFEQIVRRAPGGERTAAHLASRYVAGPTIDDALAEARDLAGHGIGSSIDCFGESVTDPATADAVVAAYLELAAALERAPDGTYLSVDLSHLGLDLPDGATGRLRTIAEVLPAGSAIQVGAEQTDRTDRILAAVTEVGRAGAPVWATLQANLRRSEADGRALVEAGVPIRVVKGAYVEDPASAYAWGEPTDLAFVRLAHELHGAGGVISLATHDAALREALVRALPNVGVEMLMGVRTEDAQALAAVGVPVRVYVPYGENWFRYAMRRLAESRGK